MGEVAGVVSTFLSEDEYLCIPEHVRKKIDDYLLKQTEEVNVYRALAHSQKRDYEQQISDLESSLSCKAEDYFAVKRDLSNASCEVSDLQKKILSLQNENTTLHEKIAMLEKQTEEYKLRHDAALSDRDNARRELEQRLCEVRICHSEIQSLTQKYDAVITENCRILRETGYLNTKEVDLKVREKELDDEREILKQQIFGLKTELKKTMEQNSYLEREHAVRIKEFEVHLSRKEEEARVVQEANEELTSVVEKLKEQLEISKQTVAQERENVEQLKDSYLQEIQEHKTMVNECQGLRQTAEERAQVIEHRYERTRKILEEYVDLYEKLVGTVEESNKDHEKRYIQLEREKEKLKDELQIANEMVKTALKESLEQDVEDLSPLLASVKRMLKPGSRLTQIFVNHAELLYELEQEQNRSCRLQKHMDTIIEELETRTPLLKMQTSDLTEAVKQNVEMELKFKEVLLELMNLRKYTENKRTNMNSDDDYAETEENDVQQDALGVEKSDSFKDVADIVDYLRSRPQFMLAKDLISEATPKRFFGSNNTADNDRLFPKSSFEGGSLAANKMSFEEAEFSAFTQQGQLELFKQQLSNMAKQLESKALKVMDMAIQTDPLPPDENIEKLQKNLDSKDGIIKDLQKQAGQEAILRQQLEERTVQGASMAAQLQVAQDGLRVLQANATGYKTKLVEVEKKSRNFSATISKQEGIIQQLKHMLDEMQRRLEHADLQIKNLQRENEMLRNVQVRSAAQQELLTVEQQRTNLLFSHLEKIQSSINQSEEEGRLRLQCSLDKYVAECADLRVKLQKSQEQYSEDSKRLQKEVEISRKECTELNQQIESLERRLTDKDIQITELSSVVSNKTAETTKPQSSVKDDQADVLMRKLKQSELELSDCKLKLQTTQELLETSRKHSVIYKDSCLKLEKDHQKLIEDFNLFRNNAAKREQEAALHTATLSQQIANLKQDLEAARAFEVKLQDCCKELESTRLTVENLKSELQEQQARTLAAEVKYSQQLLAHRDDEKSIASLRERVKSLETELADLEVAKVKAENLFQNRNEVWQKMEQSWRQELHALEKVIDTLNTRNENLYKQLGEVSARALTNVQMGTSNPAKRKRSDSAERDHEPAEKEGDAPGRNREEEDNQVPPPCKKALLTDKANTVSDGTTIGDNEKERNEEIDHSYEISSIAKSYEKLRNIIKSLHEEKNAAIVKSRTSEDNVTSLSHQKELVNTGKDALSDKEKRFEEDLLVSTRQSNVLKNESFNSLSETNMRFCKERDDLEKQLRKMREHCAVLEARLGEQDKTELETEKEKVRMLQKRINMMRKRQNRVNKQIIMEKVTLLRENDFLRRTKRLKNETITTLRKRLRDTLNSGYKMHIAHVEEDVHGEHEVERFKQDTEPTYEYEDTHQDEEQQQPPEQHHQQDQVPSEEDDVCLVDLAEEEDNTAQGTEEAEEYHDPLYTNDTDAAEYHEEEDTEYHTPGEHNEYHDTADGSEYQEHTDDPHYQHVEEDSQYHHPNGEAEYASGDEHQPYVCGVEPDYAEEDNEDAYDYEEEFQEPEEQGDVLHQHEPVEHENVMTITRTMTPGQLEDVEEDEEEEEEEEDVEDSVVTVLDSEDAESEEHSTNVNLQRLLRSGNISLVKRKDRPRNPNISGNGS